MVLIILLLIIDSVALLLLFGITKTLNRESNNISLVKYLPTNLPVIRLWNNEHVFTFLVDTGSNVCQIDSESCKRLKVSYFNDKDNSNIQGIGATSKSTSSCMAIFTSGNGERFNILLVVNKDFATVREAIKHTSQVDLDGIIGTDFLIKYHYAVDFNTLHLKKTE